MINADSAPSIHRLSTLTLDSETVWKLRPSTSSIAIYYYHSGTQPESRYSVDRPRQSSATFQSQTITRLLIGDEVPEVRSIAVFFPMFYLPFWYNKPMRQTDRHFITDRTRLVRRAVIKRVRDREWPSRHQSHACSNPAVSVKKLALMVGFWWRTSLRFRQSTCVWLIALYWRKFADR